jgi:hypothetical protein
MYELRILGAGTDPVIVSKIGDFNNHSCVKELGYDSAYTKNIMGVICLFGDVDGGALIGSIREVKSTEFTTGEIKRKVPHT